MNDRIKTLPKWAQEYIAELQTRIRIDAENRERDSSNVEYLKKLLRKKEDQVEAMVEFFRCAAKGEHEIAKAVERITADFLAPME
jgi:galactokinase/mevalonate kinase-like predicted kinase